MNEFKPILRLVVVTQTFLLFAVIFLPALIRSMHDFWGKFVYGFLAALCIVLALLLRRALSELE